MSPLQLSTAQTWANEPPFQQEFCDNRRFSDKELVRERKALLFLKDVVLPMRIPMRRKTGTIGFAITPSRYDGQARKRRRVVREDEQCKGWVEEGMNCSSSSSSNDDSNDEEYFSADNNMHAADKNESMPLMPGTIEVGYVSALVDL